MSSIYNVQWNLQKAVYGVLSSDAALKAEIGDPARIHDDPPAASPLPYIVLGEAKSKAWLGVDGGMEHDLTIHIYSRHHGRREVKRIMAALYDALHEADFAIDDHQLVNIRYVFGDAFQRDSGEVFKGVARFRAVTQATP